MTETQERLSKLQDRIDAAVSSTEADGGASPVLLAVVREFSKKASKGRGLLDDGGDERVVVTEIEQAGDSAKAAAEADGGISDATRTAIVEAHDRICVMKTKLDA